MLRIAASSYSARTDASGNYIFYSIPTGPWILTVLRSGYEPITSMRVDIAEGFEQHLNISLQPKPIQLEPSVVMGSRARETGVHYIDLERGAGSTMQSLPEILARVPGVRVYGTSESPGGTRISIAGEPPERVAVLLDGLPLSSGPNGSVNLDAIPVAALSAVEVYSGGHSATVGDAAVGGAVNLITRGKTPDSSAHVDLSAGRFGAYRQALTVDHPIATVAATVGLERHGRSDRFEYPNRGSVTDSSPAPTSERAGVKIDGKRLFLRIGRDEHFPFELLGFHQWSTEGTPGALGRLNPGAFTEFRHSRWQGQTNLWASKRSTARLGIWFESIGQHYVATRPIAFDSDLRERFFGGQLEGDFSIHGVDGHWAAEFRHRRLQGIDTQRPLYAFGIRSRNESALRGSLLHSWVIPIGTVGTNGALAIDWDGRTSSVPSPQIDLYWTPLSGLTARTGWNRSFRLPPLTSLFWKTDYHATGNPDLRPERAREWYAAAAWHQHGITAETRYFERMIKDVIVWELRGAPPNYQPVNLSRAQVIGREDHLGLSSAHGSWSLDYTHVFTDARDRSGTTNRDDSALVFTPRHTHEVSVDGRTGAVSCRLTGRWVSQRFTLPANTKWLGPYRAFDATVSMRLRRRAPAMEIQARGENLSNERIELLEGYPSPGRSWTLGISVAL